MKYRTHSILFLSTMLCGCATDTSEDDAPVAVAQSASLAEYIVTCSGGLPGDFASTLAAAGDTVGHRNDAAGFAVVTTANPAAYEGGGCSVAPNVSIQWVQPAATEELANPPQSFDDDFFFDLQWGHDAVNAVEAWNDGVRGQGVRVAVLDTGFDLSHPDLAPNIDFASSADMTGQGLQYTLADTFSHGTHTAGTIAAADNGFGTIGVAPEAQLMLVKVLYDEGYGSFADILAGMYYAADQGADVISMSIGGYFPRHLDTGPNKLTVASNHAAIYARQQGAIVIASAGNEATDYDHAKDLIHLPSDATGVVSVSATAPRGWATPAGSSFDYLASYSNYGTSVIDFAGPGGDVAYPGNETCVVGTTIPLARPCWVFDLVFSTGNGGWYWSAGTSMAAPHVAGVAALVISELGGSPSPAQVKVALRQRAVDIGKRGKDAVSGHGHVASGH